jgi:uncharacterized protein YkwD
MNQAKSKEDFCQKVLEELNFVRKDPQTYASKVRKYAKYFKGEVLRIPEQTPLMTQEGAKAYVECSDFLDEVDPLPVLKVHASLTRIAEDIAAEIQKFDKVEEMDNLNLESHISKYGQIVGHFSQAVDFGSSFSELVLLNLLVDDGDQARGNRKNILNPRFKIVGIASVSHKTFQNCTVICYARHFFNTGEKIGELSDENYEKNDVKTQKPKEEKINVARRGTVEKKVDTAKLKEIQEINDKLKQGKGSSANADDDDMDLPEGVTKIERQEKIVTEGNVQKRIIKIKKYKEDGTVEVEVKKEAIK